MCKKGDPRPATDGLPAQSKIYLASRWVMVAVLPQFGHQGGLETDQPTQMGGGRDIIQPPWTSPVP